MPNPKWSSIIVDDEPDEVAMLKAMLRKHCPNVAVRAETSDVVEAIDCVQKFEANLVFWNATLRNGDGVEMIHQLTDFQGHLIFLTPDERYLLRTYRNNAFDYLLKPISGAALKDTMNRLEIRAMQKELRNGLLMGSSQGKKFAPIILKVAGVQHVIQIPEIIHLEGDGNYSTLHLIGGNKILVSKPLKYFEDILPAKYFFRAHQSHIINLLNVKSVQKGEGRMINLDNGHMAPLARRKKDSFFTWLSRP